MNIEQSLNFALPYRETHTMGLRPDPEHWQIVDDDGEVLINIELEGDYNER